MNHSIINILPVVFVFNNLDCVGSEQQNKNPTGGEKRGVMERLDQEKRGGTIEVLEDLKRRSEMNDGINKEEWEIL